MKLVNCPIILSDDTSLDVPFAKDGDLYAIPVGTAASIIGMTARNARILISKYEEDLCPFTLSGTNFPLREFFSQNKEALGIGRLRKDMLFLTLDGFIDLCILARTPVGSQVRRQMREWYKSQIREEMISKEEYLASIARIEQEHKVAMDELQQRVARMERILPSYDSISSSAGSVLNARRGTKAWRTN